MNLKNLKRKMKEKRINYLVDNFVDGNGDLRHFVLCAVSYEFTYHTEVYSYEYNESIMSCSKGLKFGYSICRPKHTDKDGVVHEDIFDPELGKQIALGRARKNEDFAMVVNYDGDINSEVVEAFLKRRAKYFKNNPEMFIGGYKRKK